MKRVLITGAAGFIGAHLAQFLLERDCSLVLVDNLSRGANDPSFQRLCDDPATEFINVDVTDPKALEVLPRDIDTIFHFAAIVGVQNVMSQPYEVLSRNVQLLDVMITYARKVSSLECFLFTSTSEVYAGTLTHYGLEFPTPESTPLTVSDLKAPRTSYMLSKIYGEAMCLQSGLPVTIVRPHNVYGPRMGMSHVIPQLLEKAVRAPEGHAIEVYSPAHKRTFCYIDDAVRIIAGASENPACRGLTLNLGSESPEITMRNLAELILQTVGKELEIVELPPTAGSPERRAPKTSLATEHAAHLAHIGLEEGLRRTYQWYLENMFCADS